MTKPRLLDLFCCAGGAGMGYHLAGFDVVGVDIDRLALKRYPFASIMADCLTLDADFLRSFDAIHASPPCQFATDLRHAPNGKAHPNLIPAARAMLAASGLPYIIENVEGARDHLIEPITLCGSMFGLGVAGFRLERHRLFESNIALRAPGPCIHAGPVIGVYGGHVRNRSATHGGRGTVDFVGYDKPALAKEAMGMSWATMNQMSEAIPPAYTEHLGRQLLAHITSDKAAA